MPVKSHNLIHAIQYAVTSSLACDVEAFCGVCSGGPLVKLGAGGRGLAARVSRATRVVAVGRVVVGSEK